MARTSDVSEMAQREAARQVVAILADETDLLGVSMEGVDRQRAATAFRRTMQVWSLSQTEAARLFGVSRQALAKWLRHGPPVHRAGALADLAAATDLLQHYLKRDRIPTVVRRPVPALGGVSLTDLLTRGDTPTLLAACRDMFAFERVPP